MSTASKDSLRSLKAKHRSIPGNGHNNQTPFNNGIVPPLITKASSNDDVLMNNNVVETGRSASNSSIVHDDIIRNNNNSNSNSNSNANLPDIINAPSSSSNRDRDRNSRRSQGQKSNGISSNNNSNGNIDNINGHGNDLENISNEVGLTNLGNTCFMNCVLQNLFYTRPLMTYFMQAQHRVDLNVRSPKKGAIANSFADLVKDYLTTIKKNRNVYEPKAFKKSLAHHAPHLLDYQQQDAQEFLRFLLNEMAEDLCRKPPIANDNTNNNNNNNIENGGNSGETKPDISDGRRGSSSYGLPLPDINSSPLSLSDSNQIINNHSNNSSNSNSNGNSHNNVSPSATVNKLRDMTLATRDTGEGEGPPIELIDPNHSNNARKNNSNGNGLKIDVDIANNEDSSAMLVSQLTPSRPKGEKSSSRLSVGSGRKTPGSNTSSSSSLNGDSNGNATATNTNEGQPKDLLSIAKQSWATYLKYNDSIITDIFGGQLQSTVECLSCHNRTWCFDPFLDLSVPIPRSVDTNSVAGTGDTTPTESNATANSAGGFGFGGFAKKMLPRVGGGGGSGSSDPAAQTYPRRRMNSRKEPELKSCSLEDCLRKFTAQEFLDEENQITCEKCKTKRQCMKTLSLFKLPQYMVIHLKRFNFTTHSRDKVNTDVMFPMSELDMSPYISTDAPTSTNRNGALYDLVGVSHHSGGLNGGHYTAHVDISGGDTGVQSAWRFFNDARVSRVNTGGGSDRGSDTIQAGIGGPSAYMLFYRMRQEKLIAI